MIFNDDLRAREREREEPQIPHLKNIQEKLKKIIFSPPFMKMHPGSKISTNIWSITVEAIFSKKNNSESILIILNEVETFYATSTQ